MVRVAYLDIAAWRSVFLRHSAIRFSLPALGLLLLRNMEKAALFVAFYKIGKLKPSPLLYSKKMFCPLDSHVAS